MSTRRVYRYTIYSEEQGIHIPTEFIVYATVEKINRIGANKEAGKEPIIDYSAFLDVDESQLKTDGFYHPIEASPDAG